MLRHAFLLIALLLLGTSLRAQPTTLLPVGTAQPSTSSRSTASTPAQTAAPADSGAVLLFNGWYLPRYQPAAGRADTTGALLSLFRKRRYAGFLYTIPFIVGMSLALPISRTDQYGRQQAVTTEAISPPLGIAVLAGTVAAFIIHANKFNKSHLIAIDRAYAAGQPIPDRYRRLLNERHFAEAAFLREALAQQKAREQH